MKRLHAITLASCGVGAILLANHSTRPLLQHGAETSAAVIRAAEPVDEVGRPGAPSENAVVVSEAAWREASPFAGPAYGGQTTAGGQASAKAQRQGHARVDLDGSVGAQQFGRQRVDVIGSIGADQPRGNRVDTTGSIGAQKLGRGRVDVSGSIGARQVRGNRIDVGGSIGDRKLGQQRIDVTGSVGATKPPGGRVDVNGNIDTIATNWIDCEPLVFYDVNGSTLLGARRLHFSAYSDGTVTLAEYGPTFDEPRIVVRSLNTLVVEALLKDLVDAGAYTLTDSPVQAQDVPMSSVTVFGPSQAGKSQAFTFNYYPVGGPWDAVDDVLTKFIHWYFPRVISY